MKLVVTILEDTFDAALRAIRSLAADHDMVELRAERFGAIDLHALRAATRKPIILTHRGVERQASSPVEALDAGIDFVDIEWRDDLRIDAPRERIVLSHHDYDGMPDVEPLLARMLAYGCAHTKLAVTPHTLDDNLRLLRLAQRGVTLIGMGERGLYSRVLAPFRGSELTFVAGTNSAAPGQLTLERALAIYGPQREQLHATHVFAIAGNPAGHSLSPAIHNPLFREHGVDAAYTIASFASFDEIARAFRDGAIRGLSITAPFKEEAVRHADRLGDHAREAGAINTLVRMADGSAYGDNTDVDGFIALLECGGHAAAADAARRHGRRTPEIAIVGAGGTARAALVACRRIGAEVRVYNRSRRGIPSEPLENLRDADLIIDTLPVAIDLPAHIPTITARYPGGGEALLRAQAVRQNQLFREALR
jgi:3-dehydroquinate dehydratase / shikimate dehydrogenase